MVKLEKPLKALEKPDEILKAPLKLIEELDIIIRRIDEVLREFDSKILLKPPELLIPLHERGLGRRDTGIFSPSYPGQTREDACAECLERHYAKAHGLLEEAERFSLKHGKITPEAREKIRRAIEEIVTAEDDLGTEVRDEEMRKALEEIKVMQRDVRKWAWAIGLTTVSESIEDLRTMKDMVKKLLDKVYEAAERYRAKYGRCMYCEQLAREVSDKFGLSESEALESIYGLASEDKERVSKSVEKLKRAGALDYVMQRAKEMLVELREGK
ncbi:MAG: hypothetical protein QW088_07405 [Desulfurococcaceae archaeon]